MFAEFRSRSMDRDEPLILRHPFQEDNEEKSPVSSALDIDVEHEYQSPKVSGADSHGVIIYKEDESPSCKVSSFDKNGFNTDGKHMHRSTNVCSFDKNEVNINGNDKCQNRSDSSGETNGLGLDDAQESLSPNVSSFARHGVNSESENEGENAKSFSINKQGMNMDRQQECPHADVPSIDISESGHYVNQEADVQGVPKLGMEFESEDHAYMCYNRYAAMEGFSIRKDFVNRSGITGVVVSRRYTCYKQGYRPTMHDTNLKKPRKDTRTGCLAHMTIARQPCGKYRVTHFETKHNHEFVTPNAAHLFPSQRRITFVEAVEADSANNFILHGIPKLGMGFDSENRAYEFCNAYAGQMGFSVRKDYVNRSKIDGSVASRRFTCFRDGYQQNGKHDWKVKRPRKETRIGCPAQLVIAQKPDGQYRFTHFEESHNHELVPACRIHMLRSQWKSSTLPAVEAGAVDADGSKMQPKPASELICTPAADQSNFVYHPIYSRNSLPSKRMRDIKQGEAENILRYFQSKQLKGPTFFYAVQLDAEEQMANIFWADEKMLMDYCDFGDVVCFDTTCRLKKDSQPFAPFVGVNIISRW